MKKYYNYKMPKAYFLEILNFQKFSLVFFLILNSTNIFGCIGGISNGTLSLTSSFQTTNVKNGEYYTFNVSACNTYYFSFCGDGGSAAWDTELTILNDSGTTEIVYADDVCGAQTSINWTAPFTGTARILISKYSCNLDLLNSATLAYKYTPKTGSFCITDNATNISAGGKQCIQLTPEINNNKGCAWNDTKVNFNNDFSVTMDFYFGNNINGADGSTIVFQPNSPTVCGTTGGELGTGGLANAVVIEFDTYDNDFPTHAVDISPDHIAIDTDGSLLNSTHAAGPISALASNASIDDGLTHTVEISWTKATNTMSVYFDGNLRLSLSEDFITTKFGGNNLVYWGATASTGGLNNQQYFCPSESIVLPTQLISFKTECVDHNKVFYWDITHEENIDYYLLEKTTDGQSYQLIDEVESTESSIVKTYSIIDNTSNETTYYRLKMIDKNGNYTSTNLISGAACKNSNENLIDYYSLNNQQLTIKNTGEELSYKLISTTGQLILEKNIGENAKESIVIPSLNEGIYFLQFTNKTGNLTENKRVFHSIN
jgi:hypothetical protein